MTMPAVRCLQDCGCCDLQAWNTKIDQDRPTAKQSIMKMNKLCVGVQCSRVPTVREWAGLIYIQAYATGSAQTDHLVGNVH